MSQPFGNAGRVTREHMRRSGNENLTPNHAKLVETNLKIQREHDVVETIIYIITR